MSHHSFVSWGRTQLIAAYEARVLVAASEVINAVAPPAGGPFFPRPKELGNDAQKN
jgi:hypothetical protein